MCQRQAWPPLTAWSRIAASQLYTSLMNLADYDLWQTCVLVPGLSASACASWVQAWGSIGALAIAVGLQVRASIERVREQNRAKFDAINSAIVLSASISNAALALKRQHVLPSYEHLQESKRLLAEHKQKSAAIAAEARVPFHLDMHLLQLPVLELPVDLLLDLVVLRVATNGRACAAACELSNAYQALRSSVEKRNELLTRFMSGEISEELHGHHYLGEPLPGSGRHINQQHPDLVEAMLEYTNQLAFFGSYISTELQEQGEQVRARCGRGMPATTRVDFSGPRENGLMPPDTEFGRWLHGFPRSTRPATRRPWYWRLRRGDTAA